MGQGSRENSVEWIPKGQGGMVMRRNVWLILAVTALLCSATVFGQDYFLFNLESGTMKIDTDDPNVFSHLIKTGSEEVITHDSSGQNSILYFPLAANERGKLFITDNEGLVQRVVDLGYSNFGKAASADGGRVVVTYKKLLQSGEYELGFYDVVKNDFKTLALADLVDVYDAKFSTDDTVCILGLDKAKNHILLVFDLKQIRIQARINLGSLPIPDSSAVQSPTRSELFFFNPDKAVVITHGIPSSVSLVDLSKSSLDKPTHYP